LKHRPRAERDAGARQLVAWLERRAAATESPLDVGLLHRARALVRTSAATIEDDFLASLAAHCGHVAEHHVARTRLVYGEWLRRQRRRADAIVQLDLAHSTFSDIGASAFAARAHRELAAAGSRPRRRSVETRYDLTTQERKVAELAAGGATNKEIAAALFISPHTVQYHLAKVMRKLDISSRRRLSATLAQPQPRPLRDGSSFS
jgi:DNA-binding CsgD family transcriptional regulator